MWCPEIVCPAGAAARPVAAVLNSEYQTSRIQSLKEIQISRIRSPKEFILQRFVCHPDRSDSRRLDNEPGPNERAEIQALLAKIETALKLLGSQDSAPAATDE